MIGLILSYSSFYILPGCINTELYTFSLPRTVEPLSAVKANHLLGCSINDKVQLVLFAFLSFLSQMRAVLVDWLVEVQLQFKLLQV